MNKQHTKDYIAILDIGSNAVRLVIYDGLNRAPVRVYNERDICGLGADLSTTGRLNPDAVRKARASIARFAGLIDAMGIRKTFAVATAALRDAKDGASFIAAVKKQTGLVIRIIAGDEEARLAAVGVTMNSAGGECVIGDLGGGSLEIIAMSGSRMRDKISLPLGTHRLHTARTRADRVKLIDDALDSVPFLKKIKPCDFYALGGAWRSMGKAHIRMTDHPVRVVDQYAIDGKKAYDYAQLMARQSPASLEKTAGLSKKRVRDMSAAALVMERLFERLNPQRLVFSGTGLREGLIHDQLTPAQQRQDPLIASCRKMALHLGRFDDLKGYAVLLRWLLPLFPDVPPSFLRLLEANCLLSDTVWADHEDYRAELAFEFLLAAPLYGIDHAGRAFLAVSQYARYAGSVPDGSYADPHAVVAGMAMRVAYLMTGGALWLLKDSEIKVTPKNISLHLRGKAAALHAPLIEDVFSDLARVVGRAPSVKVWT
jgi:exopolyphosphatase/guanosine-5'-triphosphate,3'-diphosphate pyrophosphatase